VSDLPVALVNLRGDLPTRYAEAFLALGPLSIGVTGDNKLVDLIGREWLLILDEDRMLSLYRQLSVGEWQLVTELLPPAFASPLPEGVRRVSFCFDQSARVIFAYEVDSVVYLTRWDPGAGAYVQNVTVPGVDPCVVFDATWSYDVTVSDVLLFYLDAGSRSTLQCRVQRDLYAVEYELHDYGQPVVLDRVVRLPMRYEVLASDAMGDPLENAGERVALISDLYPYLGSESSFASVLPPTGGVFTSIAIFASPESEEATASVLPPTGGSFDEAVIVLSVDADEMTASVLSPTGGLLLYVLIEESLDTEEATAAVLPPTGGLLLYILIGYQDGEELTGSVLGPTGGSYDAA
jgi:hypothetical protein